MTFRRRFILLFFLVSLIPIALVQVYTFVFYVPSISAKVEALIDYNLEQKGQNVRLLISQDVDIIYQIAGDPAVSDTIRALTTNDSGVLALRESQLIQSFSQFSLFRDSLAGIGYLGVDGRLVEYDKYLMARDAEEFNLYFPLRQMKEAVDRNGGLQFFPTTVFRDRAGLPKNLFLVAFPFVDVARQVKSGYLFLLLKEDSVREILNPSRKDSTGILTRSFLFDQHGAIYSAPGDQFVRATVPKVSGGYSLASLAQSLSEFRGKAIETVIKPGPFPGWLLGTIFDESSVFADRDLIAIYTMLLGLFFLIFSGAISALVYRKLFRSFSELMETLRVEDLKLNLRSNNGPRDEIEILGTAWTRMKGQISELVDEVNARNASLLSVAEERRLAEIRALEAQVNPHFLYNTLNTLNWLAIRAGQDVLSQALSDLAEIMRYSISQIDVVATLQDERVWLEKYLSLQQLRFGENLEYKIIDCGVNPTFRLYKLLFQPFVENSLIHGFDLKEPGRLLEIVFESTAPGRLRATIRDNGRGFEVEGTRAKILRSSIGILNVERRLNSYYGVEATLTYTSVPGEGTVVILEIPEVLP